MHRRPFEPYLDAGVRGWIIRTSVKNLWRVASFYELDDLIQDGFLAYMICKTRYIHRVDNRAHFMSLFKRVFYSMIIDAANERTRIEASGMLEVKVLDLRPDSSQTSTLEYLGGKRDGDGEIIQVLEKAPEHIKAFITDMDEGYFFGRRPQKKRSGVRETNNEFYNRLMHTEGINYEVEIKQLLFTS